MAKAFKCDVCGNFYSGIRAEENAKRTIEIEKNGTNYERKLTVYSVSLIDSINNNHFDLDLCPDCSSALVKFLENRNIPSRVSSHLKHALDTDPSEICGNCKYESIHTNEWPCNYCDDHDKFEPKEENNGSM